MPSQRMLTILSVAIKATLLCLLVFGGYVGIHQILSHLPQPGLNDGAEIFIGYYILSLIIFFWFGLMLLLTPISTLLARRLRTTLLTAGLLLSILQVKIIPLMIICWFFGGFSCFLPVQ